VPEDGCHHQWSTHLKELLTFIAIQLAPELSCWLAGGGKRKHASIGSPREHMKSREKSGFPLRRPGLKQPSLSI